MHRCAARVIYLVCMSVCPHTIKSNDVSTAANNGSTSGISVASLINCVFLLKGDMAYHSSVYGLTSQRVRAYLVFVTNEVSLLVKKLKANDILSTTSKLAFSVAT